MVAALGAGVAQADEEGERLQGGGNRSGWRYYPRAFPASVRPFTFAPLALTPVPLSLLVPGLLRPPESGAAPAPRLPAAEKWLARADLTREPGSGDAWLLRQWGLSDDAPVAALSLAGEGLPASGNWLRADPIHQQVIRHATLLHGDAVLALTREEADQAVGALNAFFGADGLAFHAPHPGRWYVEIGTRQPPRTTPLAQLAGTNPFGHLPEGEERAFWRGVFGEAQMLLASLPFNATREAAGQPTLNGIWLWGGGALPASLPSPFAHVYADTALARGLATASHAKLALPPATIDEVPPHRDQTLVVLATFEGRGPGATGAASQEAADRWQASWVEGLASAIRRHGEIRVVMPAQADTAVFRFTPATRWRVFRRSAPLAQFT